MSKKIRIAIPNKGRIKQPSSEMLERADIRILGDERTYISETSDPGIDVIFARANDIPIHVHYGTVDLGITGHDLIIEREADVLELLDLGFGNANLVVAVPEDSPITSVDEIPSMTRVATEFPTITKKYFEEKGVQVEIVKVSGTAELAPKLGLAQIIVDLTSSGETLRKNKLKVIGTVLESTSRLACNKIAYRTSEKQITELLTKLQEGVKKE
jgi:ATP phosphoribosyltransferase